MQAVGLVAYFALGLLQLFATMAGLEEWLGVSSFFAFFIALLLAYIPFVGTVLGFFGAMNVWHWEWWQAGLLFFGGMGLVLAVGGLFSIGSMLSRRSA